MTSGAVVEGARVRSRVRRRHVPVWWPALVPVCIVVVGAWCYRWVDEDAFIDFRVVANLLGGRGPVFNVGERVEAYSDPLWVGLLAAVHGVLGGVSIEWTSVVLGLVCTAAGFFVGGLAVVRLGRSRRATTVLPIGMLVCSVVAGVWEFATSGLEMSLVFLWLGVSYLLLVQFEARRSRAPAVAVVVGLGPLIRPELLLMSAVLLATLVALVPAPGRRSATFVRRLVVAAAALALPVAYELFRAAYFALLVPSTGLAKAAGSAWWPQGFTYLWNLVAPYTLWFPALCAVPFVALRASAWWRGGDRSGVLLLLVPLAAAGVDLLYVVYIGGDYMHARLLLPALFAAGLPCYASVGQLRSWLVVPCATLVVWAIVCAGWLRFVPPHLTQLGLQTVFISNERNSWITATGRDHPVTTADYENALSGPAGAVLVRAAARESTHRQAVVVVTDPFLPIDAGAARPARSALPFSIAVNLPAIGVIGFIAGPRVYVYDEFSLANPIGSHTTVTHHARPGHEKFIGPAWMVGRFGVPGASGVAGGPAPAEVAAARRALACDPLRAYLTAITAPLTFGRAMGDLGDATSFTRMRFSPDPAVAAVELCGTHPRRRPRP